MEENPAETKISRLLFSLILYFKFIGTLKLTYCKLLSAGVVFNDFKFWLTKFTDCFDTTIPTCKSVFETKAKSVETPPPTFTS